MLNYTLKDKINGLLANEIAILDKQPIVSKEDWSKIQYEPIKQRIKRELYLFQFDKCAYCRKIIEAGAKYEPLEHIVAKSIKPLWMLDPKNLIVTCDSCNNLKGDDSTLSPEFENAVDLPNVSEAYLIFNPHYDIWDNHLRYENDIFIVPVPQTKGATTIKICKLHRYNVIVNRTKEIKLGQKEPSARILHKLQNLDYNNPLVDEIKNGLFEAMNHFLQRVIDDPDYD